MTSPDVSADQAWRQTGLIVLLFAAFGGELTCGIGLTSNNTSVFGPGLLSNTLIALLLPGIARARELVGNQDTGVLASLAVLTGLEGHPVEPTGHGSHDAGLTDG